MQESSPIAARRLEQRLPLLLLPLLALGVTLPLILHGCSCGHDIDFHFISWLEAARQLRHGIVSPHWAYSPAWNAGEPRFVFYPPISWMLGEVLALIHWPTAYIAYIVIALSASGLAFHRLARAFASPHAALIAAALYMVNPYMLFTVYERAAFAELLASAWICLLLLALLRDRLSAPAIAVSLGLLWLTNVPAALIGSYTLAAITLIRFFHGWISSRKAPIALIAAASGGSILGLCLAAVYLVPAVWESQWIQTNLARLATLLPQDNTLFAHTGDGPHDAVLHTASLIALGLIGFTLLAFAALLITRRRASYARPAPAFLLPVLLLLTLAIVVLLTRLSAPIWALLPDLAYVQFSWRWLIVLAPIAALAFASLLSRIPLGSLRAVAASALLGSLLIATSIRTFRQDCDPEDTPIGLRNLWQRHSGVEQTDEDTPNGADNDALQHGNPAYWLATDPNAQPQTSGDDTSPPLPTDFVAASPQKQFLIVNLRDYPAWRIRINGQLVPRALHQHRDDGLLAVPIIAGVSAVNLSYATTADITLGRILSLLALLRIFILFRRRPRFADL
jgi:hypothetical protein